MTMSDLEFSVHSVFFAVNLLPYRCLSVVGFPVLPGRGRRTVIDSGSPGEPHEVS